MNTEHFVRFDRWEAGLMVRVQSVDSETQRPAAGPQPARYDGTIAATDSRAWSRTVAIDIVGFIDVFGVLAGGLIPAAI